MKLLKTKVKRVIDKAVDVPCGQVAAKYHNEPIFICELSWAEYNKLRREDILKNSNN